MLADIRYALRQLVAQPGFAITALLTLAVGIGTATTAFTILDGVLYRPLPLVRDANQLVYATQTAAHRPADDIGFNALDLEYVNQRAKTISGIWGHSDLTAILELEAGPVRLGGTLIIPRAFEQLGVPPLLGRTLQDSDARPGAEAVMLITEGVWQQHFGGDPDVIDRSVNLNGSPARIVGVMPAHWRYPEVSDLWIPLTYEPEAARKTYGLVTVLRLRPGVTLEQAQTEFSTLAAQLAQAHPDTHEGMGMRLVWLREMQAADTREPTLLIFWASCAIFLIACTNVANLQLTRALGRQREIALRLALGASVSRVVRQLLIESLVLGTLGGLLGLVVALWGVDLAIGAIPVAMPFWLRFDFSPPIFVFVFITSQLAGLFCGLAPAWGIRRSNLAASLQSEGRTQAGAARSTSRLRACLVSGEIAIALVLLVGAGLMMRSLYRMNAVEAGFDASHVITFRVGVPVSMADKDKRWHTLFERLNARISALPGVQQCATVSTLPGAEMNEHAVIAIRGRPFSNRPGEQDVTAFRSSSADYFTTLRIPLKAGRYFLPSDTADNSPVAIIDEAMARRFFPEGDAIGHYVQSGEPLNAGDGPHWAEIVGIVGTVRHRLDEPITMGTLYRPQTQMMNSFMSVAVRVDGDPLAWVETLRHEVLAEDPRLPIYWIAPLATMMKTIVWDRSYFAQVFGVSAGIALLLACIGIYGVMAFHLAQRTRELGVRLALGATSRQVVGMVMSQGLRLVLIGLGLGMVMSLGAAQLMSNLLFEISPRDPPTFAFVPLLLAAVALVACYLPSRRATRVDPMNALRSK